MDDALSFDGLLGGARRFAQLAVGAHGRRDHDLFALHGGVAVERLAKAVLVTRSPTLLLEMRGSVEMLFHFTGVQRSERVRTIGAGEAIARLRKLQVLVPDVQLDALIELRNGVAHSTDGGRSAGLLTAFVKTIDALLADVSQDASQFWGRWMKAVQLAVDEAQTEVERDVRVRLQQARHFFEDRFDGLPRQSIEAARAAKTKGRLGFDLFPGSFLAYMAVDCPACHCKANLILGLRAVITVEPPADVDGLLCPLCRLVLEGADELKAAGLDHEDLNRRAREIVAIMAGKASYAHMQPTDVTFGEVQKG